MKKRKKRIEKISLLLILNIIIILGTYCNFEKNNIENTVTSSSKMSYEISDIPEYNGSIFIEINHNIPTFTLEEKNIEEVYYSELENGKCGMAIIKTSWEKANEDEEKDDYSSIIPSGFQQKKYSTNLVPGGYLYHRCHLIAWKLGGADVEEKNLMTGTQSFNVKGMKQFEDKVYAYLKENKTNHVLYKVTPYFEQNHNLASRSQYRSILHRR